MNNYDFLESNEFEAVKKYAESVENLMNSNLINQRNIVGSLGEHFVERFYSKRCPELGFELSPTKGIDATDKNGKNYQIKTLTGKRAGSFKQLENINYVVVVVLNRDTFYPEEMYICDLDKLNRKNILNNVFANKDHTNSKDISLSKKNLTANFKKIFDINEENK